MMMAGTIQAAKKFLFISLMHTSCQIFLGTTYQNRTNVPNGHKINHMAKKFLFISLMLTSAARYLLAQHTKTGRMYQTATK
jgi:hypothetical protein